jgi:hypothetical protein
LFNLQSRHAMDMGAVMRPGIHGTTSNPIRTRRGWRLG